jgi:hypothetical protein
MSVDTSAASHDALAGFVKATDQAPAGEREKLQQATHWAEDLLTQGLVDLSFSDQPQKTQWTLTMRPRGSRVALVSISNDGPASISPWGSVFERLAPYATPEVKRVIAPVALGRGNAVKDFSEELFEALTAAYLEAAAPGLGRTAGIRGPSSAAHDDSTEEHFGGRRFWWVNQNETHRAEIPGGFMWSPKQNLKRSEKPVLRQHAGG